jgi:hypothetical protein
MSRKVFTAGEVLAAADVNSFLMDQTVMSFAGTAARGSAIASPVEGMYTHLEDTDRLQFWNGSSWNGVGGLTFITRTEFTTQTAVSFDNVFTSQFDNYKIYASIRGNGSPIGLNIYLRSGTNLTTATYTAQTIEGSGTSVTGFRSASQAEWVPCAVRNDANRTLLEITVSNPAVATLGTTFLSIGYDAAGGGIQRNLSGHNTTVGAYDGITFLPQASTISGDISIYGLRK